VPQADIGLEPVFPELILKPHARGRRYSLEFLPGSAAREVVVLGLVLFHMLTNNIIALASRLLETGAVKDGDYSTRIPNESRFLERLRGQGD
jgi:hypothetical protein